MEYGNTVLRDLSDRIKTIEGWEIVEPNYEGLRVKCKNENGWFLLRKSLHDPVMPLNVESDIHGGVHLIVQRLQQQLESFTGLDYSSLST